MSLVTKSKIIAVSVNKKIKFGNRIDEMFGIRTQGVRMQGTNESTEKRLPAV